ILLNGAGAMGALRFVNEMKTLGINKKLKIGETNSLTYGTRAFPETAKVELGLRVKKLFFSAYPAENTAELIKVCRQLYDCLVPAQNILHSIIEYCFPDVHPGNYFLNSGRIYYYIEQFTH